MEQKIIFFDIDGTLYEYGKEINPTARKSIKLLKKNGHIPVICTGRTKSMVFDEIFEMGFDSIISGGGTYAEYQKKSLYLYELDPGYAKRIVQLLCDYGFMPIPEGHEYMYIDGEHIAPSYQPIYEIYREKIGRRLRMMKGEELHVSKISASILPESDLLGIEREVRENFTIVNHMGKLLELIPKPYSKAVGIQKMIEYLGISRDDTYAFGDSFNDLEMLQYVKYGIAMGNSHPDLFSHVAYRTRSMDEDGIYEGLKSMGLI